jgi:hypothetical protein
MIADRSRYVSVTMALYTCASLLHFAHNAVFLDAYPNLPDWITEARVWGSWLVLAALGLFGYLLWRTRFRIAGLFVLAVYDALGFDGLAHYAVAPMATHTRTMNLTIGLEVVAALGLLIAVLFDVRHIGGQKAVETRSW